MQQQGGQLSREAGAQAVEDARGREDLVAALRRARLLAKARQLGCSKIAVGDCATRAAVHVIAQSAKGAGFALPADIQHYDARWVQVLGFRSRLGTRATRV